MTAYAYFFLVGLAYLKLTSELNANLSLFFFSTFLRGPQVYIFLFFFFKVETKVHICVGHSDNIC